MIIIAARLAPGQETDGRVLRTTSAINLVLSKQNILRLVFNKAATAVVLDIQVQKYINKQKKPQPD